MQSSDGQAEQDSGGDATRPPHAAPDAQARPSRGRVMVLGMFAVAMVVGTLFHQFGLDVFGPRKQRGHSMIVIAVAFAGVAAVGFAVNAAFDANSPRAEFIARRLCVLGALVGLALLLLQVWMGPQIEW